MQRAPLLLAGLASLVLAAPAGAAEIEAMGGSYDEPITSIRDANGRLTVETPKRTLPLEQVKSIRFQRGAPEGEAASRLVLTNGDSLRGTIEGGDEDGIGLRSAALGALKVPLEQVRAVIPRSAAERDPELLELIRGKTENDWIRLDTGGTVRGLVDKIDGTQIAIDTETQGGSNIGTLRFDFAKVDVVAIALLEDPPPPPTGLHAVVRLVDGSSLRGKVLGLQDNVLRLEHPLARIRGEAGGEGSALELPLTRVAELVVQNGLFVYLSDLEPVEVEQRFPPEFTYEVDVWGFKRDRSVTGERLRLDGREFPKGLGVHSYSALTYPLDGQFREFRAWVGLDDSTRYLGEPGLGAVVFRVLLDGKPVPELASGVHKRKGEAPTELVVDVTGKKTLTLVADLDPASLHVLGRGDWADAHVIKKAR